MSLFADDMIFFIENPKDATRKLLELILMNVVKLKDTKSIYRNLLLFYTLTVKCQKGKLRKTMSCTIASKRKYLGMKLPTEVQDPYWKTIRQ